jgi:hypothetical protein
VKKYRKLGILLSQLRYNQDIVSRDSYSKAIRCDLGTKLTLSDKICSLVKHTRDSEVGLDRFQSMYSVSLPGTVLRGLCLKDVSNKPIFNGFTSDSVGEADFYVKFIFWESRMVVVQVQGGLGNQLFQVAAGHLLARRNRETRLFLDASRVSFGTDKSRRLEVLNFELFPESFVIEVWGESFQYLPKVSQGRLGSLAALSASSVYSKLRFKNYHNYSEGNSNIAFEDLDSNSILNGYFNDFSIVERSSSLGLSNELRLSSKPTQWLSDKMKLTDFDSSIAIHVRLGDYLKFPRIFGRISENYYLASLEEIGLTSHQRIFLFSDQPNLVANYLPKISNLKNTEIVRQPSAVPSYEILFLMSQFKNIVCANSTFSMWAAWFNHGTALREKKVFVPTPYLLDRADMVTPNSWRKISRE